MSEKKGSNAYVISDGSTRLSIKSDEPVRPHGNLTLLTGTVFIVGEVAGGGILSLPYAVMGTGWFGLILVVLCCANAGISGICLAKCWLILEERYPEYRSGLTRKPFASIGYRAFGNWASYSVSVAMNITRFGAGAVFLLLTAGLLQDIMVGLSVNHLSSLGICSWVPIVAIALTPLMWLGSPTDFWPAAYTAMLSTVIGCILLLVNIGIEAKTHISHDYPTPSFKSFFLSFGTILFAFGGASAFPNFQNDMKEKDKFPRAVLYGFIALLIIYIPISAGGYAVYGSGVNNNIIASMPSGAVTTIIEFCFFIHCFFVFLIVVNPVLLEIEEMVKIDKNFNWKRCVFRTAFMLGLIFTAESVPTFGRILDLIGGSTITLMAFIMPPAFYYKLCNDSQYPKKTIPMWLKIALVQIVIVGLVGGFASIASSIESFASPSSHLEPACYAGRSNKTYFYE